MNAHYRDATAEDVVYVACHLRKEDKAEIQAGSGVHPIQALMHGYHDSDPCYTMIAKSGNPFGMFGVVEHPEDPSIAFIWMLATDEIEENKIAFGRGSKKFIEELSQRYRILQNSADARNVLHLKWLKWLGFTFTTVSTQGVEGRPFVEFIKVNSDV